MLTIYKLNKSKFLIYKSVITLFFLIWTTTTFAASTGGCNNYTPDTNGSTVTCSPSISPSAIAGVISTSSNTTVGNNLIVTIEEGTILNISGSTIGVGSGSTINNFGTLNTNSSSNGYGISIGVNSRSQAGGGTINNYGTIISAGLNADGIAISSTNATSKANLIYNYGSISTTGSNADGIYLKSGTTLSTQVNSIINNGTITVSGPNSIGILVDQGQANITNNGTINANTGTAISFNAPSSNGLSNSVTLGAGSATTGALNFNSTNQQETLTFNGLVNSNFDNTINGLNIINAVSNANVTLTNSSGYTLVNGKINVDGSSSLGISSAITDASISSLTSITKEGAGVLTLSGINTYTGPTTINNGVIALTGSLTSNVTINSGGTLKGGGTVTGNVTNAGAIIPSITGNLTNLTINGNYIGQSGIFLTNIYSPSSSPTADQLIISGTSSGTTNIKVIDNGGLGKPTTGNGIRVITSGSNANSNTYTLSGRVASGAYEYKLGVASDNNWYLTSSSENPPAIPITPDARERIEVAVYPATPTLARMYINTTVDTLDQRRGDLSLLQLNEGNETTRDWARLIGNTGNLSPQSINDGPKMNFSSFALQFGSDIYRKQFEDGSRTYFGPYATVGSSNSGTSNTAGTTQTGNTRLDAYSLGLNATHFLDNGIYFDGLLQGTRFANVSASSTQNANINTTGWGFAGSFETGIKIPLTNKVSLTPQAQVVFTSNNLASTTDAYGQISFQQDNATRARIGLMLASRESEDDKLGSFWLRTSLWESFNKGTSTTFQSLYGVNPISFNSTMGGSWISIDGGFTARLSKSSYAFLNGSLETSINNPSYQTVSGRFGVQTRF